MLSSTHVTVLDVDVELPHPSVTIHVLVRVVLQPEVTTRSEEVLAVAPQLSVAVTVPNAALMAGPF